MSRHSQPVRIVDSALVTEYQRRQAQQAKSRSLTTVLLLVVVVVLVVVAAAAAVATGIRPAAAQETLAQEVPVDHAEPIAPIDEVGPVPTTLVWRVYAPVVSR